MIKKNELSEDNSSKKNEINQEKNVNQTKNINKTNKNIINKIHSIKASINNNNNNENKFHFIRRKNNFRRAKDPSVKKNTTSSKSKNKEINNSFSKNNQKNKFLNEKKNINNNETLNNNLYNNCSLNESNSRKNNFYENNQSNNNNMNNNNIIITINNYNKITPTKIVNTANINDKKIEIKYSNDKKFKKNNKNELKYNKKYNEKKEYNNYKTGHNYSLDNSQNNVYNNNIFYNQVIYNKNDNNLINPNEDNNIDNISINTYNTINKSNNLINSNNNTSNREYSNKALPKKMNKYQDNIILKKKQLEMYSPLSFLKKNLEVDKKTLDNLIFNEKNLNDNLSSFNNTNINSKFTSTTELGVNENKEKNKNKKEEENNNNNNDEDLTKIIIDKIEQNIKNKKQVGNILSTLNRIKNTKQLYKNKKLYGYTKITKKKAKPLINSNRNNFSFSKIRPYNYNNKRDYSFNDRLYYSRSNSKNALSNSFNMKYKNLNKNRTSKSNQKLINKSFTSENRENLHSKKKLSNHLLSSHRQNNDRLYTLNNQKIRNIKTEKNQIKNRKNINDSISINTSINDIRIPFLTESHKPKLNNTNKITNIKNNLSLSNNNDTSFNNNKIIDTYESATIANIDKHCDSLLSKINKKIKERESHNIKNIFSKNDINLNENNSNKNKIYKKLIANASLCRKGLNRPDEDAKINQDSLFKVKFGDLNYSYYGVCDGHGPLGHLVSDFIKSNLTFIVYKNIKSLLIQKTNFIDVNSNNSINLNSIDDSFIDFNKLFKESFLLMESKLSENKNINIELSGTTCISLLFCEDRIISSNIGDSRAIKGFYNEKNNKWEYIPLSRDHKPSVQDEAERIKNCKGKIHPYIDEDGKYVGPDRVWNEEEELPGLAMSRSFGDEIAKKIGVYSEPEVKIFPYNEGDKFIVIASDGLWEYVSNKEVIDIVGEYHEKNDCDGAVSKLYELSKERWIKYDDYIDDISIIVAFLDNIK